MDIDADPPVDRIAAQLNRLQRIRNRTVAQLATAHGAPDPTAYACLFRLLSQGPMRSGALADALYTDASTISRQVAHLVGQGLIERLADPADGRACVLAVTDRGHDVAEQIRRRRTKHLGRVVEDWTDDERTEFARLLERFVDDYEQRRPEIVAEMHTQIAHPIATEENT